MAWTDEDDQWWWWCWLFLAFVFFRSLSLPLWFWFVQLIIIAKEIFCFSVRFESLCDVNRSISLVLLSSSSLLLLLMLLFFSVLFCFLFCTESLSLIFFCLIRGAMWFVFTFFLFFAAGAMYVLVSRESNNNFCFAWNLMSTKQPIDNYNPFVGNSVRDCLFWMLLHCWSDGETACWQRAKQPTMPCWLGVNLPKKNKHKCWKRLG